MVILILFFFSPSPSFSLSGENLTTNEVGMIPLGVLQASPHQPFIDANASVPQYPPMQEPPQPPRQSMPPSTRSSVIPTNANSPNNMV